MKHSGMAGKGSSRLTRSNGAQPRHVNKKANHPPSSKHGNDNKGDPSLSAVIKLIATFHCETHPSMSILEKFNKLLVDKTRTSSRDGN